MRLEVGLDLGLMHLDLLGYSDHANIVGSPLKIEVVILFPLEQGYQLQCRKLVIVDLRLCFLRQVSAKTSY